MRHLCPVVAWALCILCPFLLLWFYLRRDFRTRHPGANVAFDPIEPAPAAARFIQGGFEPHARRYQDLAKLLLTIAAATIAFLVNFLASIHVDEKRSPYSLALESACPFSICLLGLSALCAILFLFSENYAYETYCHDPNRNTYTPGWYALNLSLAFFGFLFFFLGYAFLAFRILW